MAMLNPKTEFPDFDRSHGYNSTKLMYNSHDGWPAAMSGAYIHFRADMLEDDSGACSPPLWKTSPPASPRCNYGHLSPNSRAQAIARGQWELMEMLKNMPESCYELSLKDLVEFPREESQEECLLEEKISENQRAKAIKRQESKEKENKSQVNRSGSIHSGGLLLKMFFPISLGSRKRSGPARTSSRVSPRPESSDKYSKKRFPVPSEGESGTSRKKNGRALGCWPLFSAKIFKTGAN